MSTSTTPDDDDRTESHDSVLFEFVDPPVDYTPRPPREETLRHAPAWLRERAAGQNPGVGGQERAAVLMIQARAHVESGRYAEAAPVAEEALMLYEAAGNRAAAADCLHLAAVVNQALGRPAEALDFLRREVELRRRLSA